MLDAIKTSMRITHNMLDDDIRRDIDACLADIGRVGVIPVEGDALIIKLCEMYCKGMRDYGGKGEQWLRNYERLRDALSMTEGYADV